MRYTEAKQLRKGQEVVEKRSGTVHHVVDVGVDVENNVFVRCDDGNVYLHIALQLPSGRKSETVQTPGTVSGMD